MVKLGEINARDIRRIQEDNDKLKQENLKLRAEMSHVMNSSQAETESLHRVIRRYERNEHKKQEEIDRLTAQISIQTGEKLNNVDESSMRLESGSSITLQGKVEECSLLNKLLEKKQEDFHFSTEELKDIKLWSKKAIAHVSERAREEIAKRDRKIFDCELEISSKQETIDQVLKLLHREKIKCEKLVLATKELTHKFEGDMEYKLRMIHREVERVLQIGQEMYRVWPSEQPLGSRK